jgi:hypothetical protein
MHFESNAVRQRNQLVKGKGIVFGLIPSTADWRGIIVCKISHNASQQEWFGMIQNNHRSFNGEETRLYDSSVFSAWSVSDARQVNCESILLFGTNLR